VSHINLIQQLSMPTQAKINLIKQVCHQIRYFLNLLHHIVEGAQEGEETSVVEAKANNLFKPTLTTYHVKYAPSGVMVLLIVFTALTYGIPVLLHHHHRRCWLNQLEHLNRPGSLTRVPPHMSLMTSIP
jgi:hypothetical protein